MLALNGPVGAGKTSLGHALERLAGLGGLKLVVITVPGFHDSMAVLQQIRHMAPDATILVRSRYRLHQQDFRDAGADIVVGDEEEVGTALCEAIQKLRTA